MESLIHLQGFGFLSNGHLSALIKRCRGVYPAERLNLASSSSSSKLLQAEAKHH